MPNTDYYPRPTTVNACLFVDYPTSDEYKLVILDQRKVYKLHILTSSGLWHEFQIRKTKRMTQLNAASILYWLVRDGLILIFDAKREEASILNPSTFISIRYKQKPKQSIIYNSAQWLVIVQGKFTFIHTYHKCTVTVYNYEAKNQRVSPTFEPHIYAILPICIDSKQVIFLLGGGCLYENDFDMNKIKKSCRLQRYMV